MSTATERLTRVQVTVGDQELTFETGKLAKQADGAVVVRSGETMVLATAQGRMEAREGADFFPLTVDVEERMYAAGKIPGGFFKREGRPTERAILTARMIDRPIRPLWPTGFRNEVQVICTVLSADLVPEHDLLCIAAEGLREAGAIVEEILPELSMDSTVEDVTRQTQMRQSLAIIMERARLEAVLEPVRRQFEDDLRALTEAEQDSKELKSAKRSLLFDRIEEEVELPFPVSTASTDEESSPSKDSTTRQFVKRAAEAIYKELVRQKIAVEKRRPDGRGTDEIRPVTCAVSVPPRTHGSALFTRGQTQILSLLTLGTAKEGQRIDDLSLETDRRYMHHYNFPP